MDAPTLIDLGYEYYPNNEDYYRLYEVKDIIYNDFAQTIDTITYEVVEVFTNTFNDLEGRESRELHRYEKRNGTNWVLKDVWTSTKTQTRVEQVEENQRVVKLTFPVRAGNEWNGYAFADLPDEDFEVLSLKSDTVVNGISINEFIEVLNYEDENILERRIKKEKYGKTLGLIHLYLVDLDLQKDSGIIRNMWIKDTGFNFSF